MLDNITMTGLESAGGEAMAVSLPQIIAFFAVSLALFVLFVLIMWRWDVAHAGRLPHAIERQIHAFAGSVVIWDFESAEQAASEALGADRLHI